MSVDTSVLEQAVRDYAVTKLAELADAFVFVAQGNAPRRTGALAESISHDEPTVAGDTVSCTATCTADYAEYQEEGTGVFGPDGVPITPRRKGGVLAFDMPSAGGMVFARSVLGTEPTHFWQRSLDMWGTIVAGVA